MKTSNAILTSLCLGLLWVAAVHSATAPTITTVTVPITGKALGADSTVYEVSGTALLTITSSGSVIPPTGSITGVTDPNGAALAQAMGGAVIFIKGLGLGASGTARVAGQAAAVLDWQPTYVKVKLPVVGQSQAGKVELQTSATNIITSTFSFAILGSAPPPPPPVPGPVPGQVEFPAGSGWLWKEGRVPGWAPHGPTSQQVAKP